MGLKASHAVVDAIREDLAPASVVVGPSLVRVLGGTERPLRVKRLY